MKCSIPAETAHYNERVGSVLVLCVLLQSSSSAWSSGLYWQTQPGSGYEVQSAQDLNGGWEALGAFFVGDRPLCGWAWTNFAPGAGKYFQLRTLGTDVIPAPELKTTSPGDFYWDNTPELLLGGKGMPPTILNYLTVDKSDARLRYCGVKAIVTSGPYGNMYRNAYPFNGGEIPMAVEFEHLGDKLEVELSGSGRGYRLWVDGLAVTDYCLAGPPDGDVYILSASWRVRRQRHIRFEFSGNQYIGNWFISPDSVLTAPTNAIALKCVVLGDSFTEGVGANSGLLGSFAWELGYSLGWDVVASGQGGAGYLNPGPRGTTLRGRLTNDCIDLQPQFVVIAEGINDMSLSTNSLGLDLQTEAGLVFDAILQGIPNVQLAIVGPWSPSGNASSQLLAVRDAIRQAAVLRGISFIDPIVSAGSGWVTGSGYWGNPRKDGNADWVISGDGTHPTWAGHGYLGWRLAQGLRSAGMPTRQHQ
jgi:hypothetical protein